MLSAVGALGLVDHRQHLGLERGALADHPDGDAVAMQLGEIAADEALHQAHQIVDLVRRPRPVLGREAVDRDELDAEFHRRPHRAGAPPRRPCCGRWRAAGRALRPAAVAVHDDARRGAAPRPRPATSRPRPPTAPRPQSLSLVPCLPRRLIFRVQAVARAPAGARRSDLVDLGFLGRQHRIDFLDDAVGQLLHLVGILADARPR